MISGSFRQNAFLHLCVVARLRAGCSTRAAGLPLNWGERHRSGGACARPPLGICPQSEGAKRRQALVRNAAPGGSPCGKARPFSGREQPAHNADRRAYRRLTAAFSLDPETAFWKRTGAADRRTTPLIPRAFPRVHPPPPAGLPRRTHVVGPGSVSRGPRRFG